MVPADPPSGAHRARRRWRPVLAVIGLVLAAVFFLVYQRCSRSCRSRAGRRAGAITAAGAQLATQRFVARSERSPPTSVFRTPGRPRRRSIRGPKGRTSSRASSTTSRRPSSTVHILMFGWREGEVGTKLADLLVEKLNEGVEVRIVVDAAGSKPYGPAEAMFTGSPRPGAADRRQRHLPAGTGTACTRITRASTGRRTTSAAPTTASST